MSYHRIFGLLLIACRTASMFSENLGVLIVSGVRYMCSSDKIQQLFTSTYYLMLYKNICFSLHLDCNILKRAFWVVKGYLRQDMNDIQ